MLIRSANHTDEKDLFIWRNDHVTRKMFFDEGLIKKKDHNSWFQKVLKSKTVTLYIAEEDGVKIGVCRFDLNKNKNYSEVSINLNPRERNKRYSSKLLSLAIQEYLKYKQITIQSKIKKNNLLSIRLFEKVGFYRLKKTKDYLIYILSKYKLQFKNVEINKIDAKILYDLLKNRKYNISHQQIPTFSQHLKFIKNAPYLHWQIIYNKNKPIGTVYIQNNNSIGLNLNSFKDDWIYQIISYIKNNFTPQAPAPSLIPSYFFINVPVSNKKLIKLLNKLNLENIQVSYKI